jgi:peptidoglycan hydrolase-like protein with peptidoglycan-binding domain
MKGWLDNFGKADNANDSNVSFSENYVGLGNDTKGRKFSPAWGGQFQDGGFVPLSPMQQVTNVTGSQINPTPTVPYKQTKDPVEFYKSWITSPEYRKRKIETGYQEVPNVSRTSGRIINDPSKGLLIDTSIKNSLSSLENLQKPGSITYDPTKRSEYYKGSKTANINPKDYNGAIETVRAHEIAHAIDTYPSDLSEKEKNIISSSTEGWSKRLPNLLTPELWEIVRDAKHIEKPEELRPDLNALRFLMYDKGVYDIREGKKFTKQDLERAKEKLKGNPSLDRTLMLTGEDNFINLMNVIAQNNDEGITPIANNGASLPGATGPVKKEYGGKISKAQDGILEKLKTNLNPYNWGVTDYTDKYPDKDKAFAAARKSGEKEYLYKGVRYTTESDMTPEQQMKVYGITDNQRSVMPKIVPKVIANPLREIRKNISKLNTRDGYKIPLSVITDIAMGKSTDATAKVMESDIGNVDAQKERDAFNLYLGLPQSNNTFKPSKYKEGAFELVDYLEYFPEAMPSDEIVKLIGAPLTTKELYEKLDKTILDPKERSRLKNIVFERAGDIKPMSDLVMGRHTVRKGIDDDGEYLEYIDEWDLDTYKYNAAQLNDIKLPSGLKISEKLPFGLKIPKYDIPVGEISDKLNKPFSIYGRQYYKDYGDGQKKKQYYSDRELSGLDVNKKNFDTKSLQKEFSNRGYKLPKSTKEDNTFDGILGEETKKALEDFQNKNKSFATGGSIPGTPGFTYARTGDIPSKGKYAKKTMASAQDGLKTVSTTSPEYKQLYENRQIGRWLDNDTFDSQVPLDEVVVRGNDERVLEGMRNTRQGFLEGVGTAMSFPQQEMVRMITGKERQFPSEAWGFDTTNNSWYHPKSISNFAMDAVLDPMNLVGVGLVDDLSKGAIRQGLKKSTKPGITSSVNDVNKGLESQIVKSSFPNPIKIADRIIPGPFAPGHFLGIEDSWNNYSPINLIPGYGEKLIDASSSYPNFVGFRKFGNSIDDVIESQSLRPGGSGMGSNQVKNEGNWAQPGKVNEHYSGVFEATMNPQIQGSNIKLEKWAKRNGIVGTTKEGDVAIPLTDPGLSFNRRLPFSNRYVPIDKQKLIDKEFQLATQLPHLQSLAEKYGIWSSLGLGASYLGVPTLHDANKKYIINPTIEKYKKLNDKVTETLNLPKWKNGGIVKSMQNGGDLEKISINDPRYPEMYRNRQVGSWSPQYEAYNLPDLPEVTVRPQSYSMDSLRDFTTAALYGAPANAMKISMIPQAAMTEGIEALRGKPYDFSNVNPNFGGFTSNQRDLAQTMGYENPEGFLENAVNFGLSAIDPSMIAGGANMLRKPLQKGLQQSNKLFREAIRDGVVPVGYGLERVLDIPENIKRVRKFGMQKKMPNDVKNLINNSDPSRAADLQNRYFKTLRNREAPWNTYLGLSKGGDNMKFAGIDPKTGFEKYELSNVIDPLNPEEARYLSQDLTNNLFHDLNRSTIVAKDKTFDVMGGYSQFLSPDKKSIMYRDIWDLQPLKSKLKGKGKIAEKIGEFEVSSLIPGAKPFVSEGKIADVKTKYYPTSPYKNINQRFSDHFSDMLNVYDPEYLVDIKDFDNPTPEEISKYYKIIESFAKENLHKEIKEGKSFLNDSPRYRDSKKYADISPYLKVQSNKKLKKKNGGIIEDDMGYWNPDNHGKPVRVNSNVITMEGVYEPLLGISDTGDTKLMEPGKNYKFKGKKVTEFPVAKLGINQLDAQPMKKLNQLTNFTNNPDKTNWLDKYN